MPCPFCSNSSAKLEGQLSAPFIRGVATFTRLRVDQPSSNLRLRFSTTPDRFEAVTSVLFTVVSPPENTPRQTVYFMLKGDLEDLPSWAALKEAIKVTVANLLDVDVSRVLDITITVRKYLYTR